MISKKFWNYKKVLITGHTGFKGSWLTRILLNWGSNVIGVSYDTKRKKRSLIINKHLKLKEYKCNVLNKIKLNNIFKKEKPEIVFHLAAISLVLESYQNPMKTFEINFNGTINILNQFNFKNRINSMIIVTSDKCYKQKKKIKVFQESDELGGDDPYSASKACVELATHSFNFVYKHLPISSVRAGNVIGGGDWNDLRLIPDLIKHKYENKNIIVRNPNSIRPWQHVLEPLFGYIKLAEKIYKKKVNVRKNLTFNFGPSRKSKHQVQYIISFFNQKNNFKFRTKKIKNNFNEVQILMLNSSKSKKLLNWKCKLNINQALDFTFDWYDCYFKNRKQIDSFTNEQIIKYMKLK